MTISRTRQAAGPAAFLVFAAVAGWGVAGAAGLKSDSKVKVDVKAQKSADNTETCVITLNIEKGWHIYANPVGLDDLASSQTVVTIDGKPKPEGIKIDYPAGKVVKDAIVGDHKTYEDQVIIKAQFRRGAAGPVTVAVRVQACNEKTCLQAATVKTTVP